jgi:hypothetical protein
MQIYEGKPESAEIDFDVADSWRFAIVAAEHGIGLWVLVSETFAHSPNLQIASRRECDW